MPRSRRSMAPARGQPFTSFCMAAWGRRSRHSESGTQWRAWRHSAASMKGAWLKGIAMMSIWPPRTTLSNSLRRWGEAARHQSSTVTMASAVQWKRLSFRQASSAELRKRTCMSRHTEGRSVKPTSVWEWWMISTCLTRPVWAERCEAARAGAATKDFRRVRLVCIGLWKKYIRVLAVAWLTGRHS